MTEAQATDLINAVNNLASVIDAANHPTFNDGSLAYAVWLVAGVLALALGLAILRHRKPPRSLVGRYR